MTDNLTKNRDVSIDVLRFIAISCIILAHTTPPHWQLYQLRNFDVPMMVLLSGVSYSISGGLKSSYRQYIWKRTKRLIFPTWFFLTFYFPFYSLLDVQPSLTKIILLRDYALIPDPNWYVWIIRVFFIIALLSPIINKVNTKLSTKSKALVCVGLFILVECLSNTSQDYLIKVCLETIVYSIIFGIGINIIHMRRRNIIIIASVFSVIFVFLFFHFYIEKGHIVLTQSYKYPPRIYYVSYAMTASLFLYLIRNHIIRILNYIKLLPITSFIGRHTLWIYFWHIPMLLFFKGDINWMAYYVLVYAAAVSITLLQSVIVSSISNNIRDNNFRQDFKKMFDS